jgi:hypothetical protein
LLRLRVRIPQMACKSFSSEFCVLLFIEHNVIFITNMETEYSKGIHFFVISFFEKGVGLVFRKLYIFVRGQKYHSYGEDAGRRFSRNTHKNIPDCTESHSRRQLSSI